MEVVRGRVCFYRQSAMVGRKQIPSLPGTRDGAEPCLFSYLSYKEDVVKYGQLGDRFTA